MIHVGLFSICNTTLQIRVVQPVIFKTAIYAVAVVMTCVLRVDEIHIF